jgi:hypothetical protein
MNKIKLFYIFLINKNIIDVTNEKKQDKQQHKKIYIQELIKEVPKKEKEVQLEGLEQEIRIYSVATQQHKIMLEYITLKSQKEQLSQTPRQEQKSSSWFANLLFEEKEQLIQQKTKLIILQFQQQEQKKEISKLNIVRDIDMIKKQYEIDIFQK